jgi:hypothetical protein
MVCCGLLRLSGYQVVRFGCVSLRLPAVIASVCVVSVCSVSFRQFAFVAVIAVVGVCSSGLFASSVVYHRCYRGRRHCVICAGCGRFALVISKQAVRS